QQVDLFLHDRQTGATERVSLGPGGVEGNNGSYSTTAVTPDARYVAFPSLASNFAVGDSNLEGDVFVRDRQAGTTERVSIGSSGAQGDGDSDLCVISADGRYVAFA